MKQNNALYILVLVVAIALSVIITESVTNNKTKTKPVSTIVKVYRGTDCDLIKANIQTFSRQGYTTKIITPNAPFGWVMVVMERY